MCPPRNIGSRRSNAMKMHCRCLKRSPGFFGSACLVMMFLIMLTYSAAVNHMQGEMRERPHRERVMLVTAFPLSSERTSERRGPRSLGEEHYTPTAI